MKPLRRHDHGDGHDVVDYHRFLLGAWCKTLEIVFPGTQPCGFQSAEHGFLRVMHQFFRRQDDPRS
jgi:hypothetical protein